VSYGIPGIIQRFRALREGPGPPWMLWKAPRGEVILAAGERVFYSPSDTSAWRNWLKGLRPSSPDSRIFFLLAFDPEAEAGEPWIGMPRAWAFEADVLLQMEAPSDAISGERIRSIGEHPGYNGEQVGPSYEDAVNTGLGLLRAGGIDKIVLARNASYSIGIGLDEAAERMLGEEDSFCILFSPDGERVLLSVTPERLARVDSGTVYTAALAGTALRSDDGIEDTDADLHLRESVKEDEEHAYVVRMIREALSAVSSDVHIGERRVFALPHVYHLITDITAKLRDGVSLCEVVSLLHPTPAVAGVPRDAAMTAIGGIEGFDRGLFAGVVGWMDSDGNGDAAVTIRSALLQDGQATVCLLYTSRCV